MGSCPLLAMPLPTYYLGFKKCKVSRTAILELKIHLHVHCMPMEVHVTGSFEMPLSVFKGIKVAKLG